MCCTFEGLPYFPENDNQVFGAGYQFGGGCPFFPKICHLGLVLDTNLGWFMVEKLRQCLDNKGSTGILLTDLSKAFDCLVHDLLIAKLHAYGFEYNAIKLIYSYFNRRYQRVRINSTYSSWSEIVFDVPQASI